MVHPSWLEIAILAILLCISGTLFWRRFRKPLDAIRRSRDNPDFHLRPLAPRIRQFVWEVMLQGKVIRERPLPGIAHAFVFWGFCAFALITLNHVAAGFGFPFLSREGAFGKAYFAFVAVWAVLVAVSIAGLAARRFLAQPKWLGKVAPESGIIALLIFILMVTYLAGWAMDESTAAARVNWWLHTATLLASCR